jgi:hypothetical protein
MEDVMAVNVKLLRKVRKLIAEEPARLGMEYWGIKVKDMIVKPKDPPPCGTVACLAGWTVLAARPKKEWPKMFYEGQGIVGPGQYGQMIADKAATLLGFESRNDCPFHETTWGVRQVLNWIDEQIAKAK